MTEPLMSVQAPHRAAEPARGSALWLVVINHHEARVFRTLAPGTASVQIRPDQSEEGIRHQGSFTGFARGQEKPEEHTFFRPVADALADAPSFIVFGSGTGTANEMNQFIAWLRRHLPDTARRIIGVQIVDEHHLTDAQLLARARDLAGPTAQAAPAPGSAPADARAS